MELGLSLGDKPKPFSFLEKSKSILEKDLGFCMAIGGNDGNRRETARFYEGKRKGVSSSDPSVQLDLLSFSPVHRSHQPSINKFPSPWFKEKLVDEPVRGLELNWRRGREEMEEETRLSSPKSPASSFQMDFSILRIQKGVFQGINLANNIINESETDIGASNSSRGITDEEENGMSSRKKLRLTKKQAAFLEESFKEHNTLNPRQKIALAKQLNLRPRQVEVWFQNRRARTKLKQTEVDCEYLKRCCETLTEENKRLTKELQELRVLKSSKPFYKQLPATTLTMCPSCERVATTTTYSAANKTT